MAETDMIGSVLPLWKEGTNLRLVSQTGSGTRRIRHRSALRGEKKKTVSSWRPH